MTTGDTIVAVVSLLACLVLATRGLRARNLGTRNAMLMGVAWAAIIAALAFVLQRATR